MTENVNTVKSRKRVQRLNTIAEAFFGQTTWRKFESEIVQMVIPFEQDGNEELLKAALRTKIESILEELK